LYRRYGSVLLLRNKKPAWDPALRASVLDFQGRVTESSVKNFQLVAEVRGGGNGNTGRGEGRRKHGCTIFVLFVFCFFGESLFLL
jgi:hypothetical protein